MTLYFIGGKTAECEITKEGSKHIYFQTKDFMRLKYRMVKATGEVQISPYWNTEKKMRVEM